MIVARRVCGDEAANRLMMQFGGQRIYFPLTVMPDHPLAKCLGQETAQLLCNEIGRVTIFVKGGHFSEKAMRLEIVKWGEFAGLSRRTMAALSGYTEGHVYWILGRLRADGALPANMHHG